MDKPSHEALPQQPSILGEEMNTLGQVAYKAWWKSHGGDRRIFDQLTLSERTAWEASAKAVVVLDVLAKADVLTKVINELNDGKPIVIP